MLTNKMMLLIVFIIRFYLYSFFCFLFGIKSVQLFKTVFLSVICTFTDSINIANGL